MICAVIKGPSLADAKRQIDQAIGSADLVELRLDHFSTLDIKALREAFTIPMIFTLRSKEQGGNYPHSEEQRLSDIRLLAALQPEYLDLESHVAPPFVEEMARLSIKIIISYHDFDQTPDDLDTLFRTMQRPSATLYKLAVTAKNTLDALRLLCFAKSKRGLIAISMGPDGLITRIIGPIIGSPITYAGLDDNLQTAPGQLSLDTLIHTYGYRSLNPKSAIYGLIGDPVDKSISAVTHNHLIQKCGLDAVYIKMRLKPDEVPAFFPLAKQLPIRGLSVTMPLKEIVLPHLDLLDASVQDIGASNTLVFEAGTITGYNTDGLGALNAIEKTMKVQNKKMVIIGAGGAAKAIAYEACRRGARVVLLNRDVKKAEAVACHLKCIGKGLDAMKECFEEGYDLLINGTPADFPIDPHYFLPQALVMDIRTRPKNTPFLQVAQQKGCKLVYGYEMFVEQAVGQWSLWINPRLDTEQYRTLLTEKSLE